MLTLPQITTINPASGEEIARYDERSAQQIERAPQGTATRTTPPTATAP